MCAHVDTLSPPALYVPTPGTPYPLCRRVFIEQTLNIPDLLFMYMNRGGGGLFLSFTIETRHVLIPLSFPLSRPPSRRLAGRVQASRLQQNRCPVFWTRRLSASFSSLCGRLAGTDAPKNNSRERKTSAGSCQGDACCMLLSVTSLMCSVRK